jgi:hypothetical protein
VAEVQLPMKKLELVRTKDTKKIKGRKENKRNLRKQTCLRWRKKTSYIDFF